MAYEKFTFDLGELKLYKKDIAELEKAFEGPGEYLVLTDELADSHVKSEILSNLWAFGTDFLAVKTGLPSKVFSCLIEKMGKGANDAIRSLIQCTCSEASVVNAAVKCNSRGQFLSSYDGDELTYTTKSGKVLYLYRCN